MSGGPEIGPDESRVAPAAVEEAVEREPKVVEPRDERFGPDRRLRSNLDFRRVFDERRSVSDERLIVYGRAGATTTTRLGISVAKKRVRRAVDRNRAKRLLREAFRTNRPNLPQPLDLVVVVRGPLKEYAAVEASLVSLVNALAHKLNRRSTNRQAPP